MLLFVGAAAGAALWYVKYRRHRPVLWVETRGPARLREARTADWKNTQGRFSVREKDNLQFAADTFARVGVVTLPKGNYDVARLEDGELGLVPSTTEAFQWEPQPLGLLEFKGLEAELVGLRQEMARHREIPNLWPVKDWLPMKGLELEFTDYFIKLVEPPSGRRLSPDADIRLLWTPIPLDGTNYSVEIAGSMEFRGVVPRSTKTNRLSVHLSQPGLYFWRVRAIRRGRTVLSNSSSFEVR